MTVRSPILVIHRRLFGEVSQPPSGGTIFAVMFLMTLAIRKGNAIPRETLSTQVTKWGQGRDKSSILRPGVEVMKC